MVGLWSLVPRSTIVQLYHGSQFVLLVGETSVCTKQPTCRKLLTKFIT